MADAFEELGIRSELVEATKGVGYSGPTPLQRAAIPVLRRGGNVVLHEAAGAGVVGAYGLALLDRLAGGGEEGAEAAGALRALVLVPTEQGASRTAVSLARFARAVGLRAAALGPGWAGAGQGVDVVVATPRAALEAVQAARLKLEGVQTLVLDGLSVLFELGGEEAVETLTNSVPRAGQRVVVTAELTRAVEDYIERHIRRTLRLPPVPVEAPGAARREPARPVAYAVVAESEKLEALSVLLGTRGGDGAAVVYCRSDARAADLVDALALRGFRAGRVSEEGADVVVATTVEAVGAGARAISFDVPFDPESLASRHAAGGVVLIEPRELPHLRLIAERANFEPKAETVAVPVPARDEIAGFRERLRRALAEEDLGAHLLVLEPLFAEASPAEVAAAASALLRRRAPVPTRAAAPAAKAAAPAPPTYTRLFLSVGAREGVRPGDLVGAITGEAKVTGDQIGRIEIRDNFSIVEVASDVADRVIQALNGTTFKGRSLRVDYDRRAVGPAARGGPRPRRRPPSPRE